MGTKTKNPALLGWRAMRRRWPALHGVTIGPVLDELGWIRSTEEDRCVDRDGNPVPWITYPAISFLEARAQPSWRVFEWGAGSSSAWWAARVAEVVSVEDHPEWAERVRAMAPENVTVLFRPGDDYFTAPNHGTFQVVTIDGAEPRNRCAEPAIGLLADDGVILWDNTDRVESYGDGMARLTSAGFRRVDFDGLTPLNNMILRTTVFYRDGNCLGL